MVSDVCVAMDKVRVEQSARRIAPMHLIDMAVALEVDLEPIDLRAGLHGDINQGDERQAHGQRGAPGADRPSAAINEGNRKLWPLQPGRWQHLDLC